MVVEFAVNGNQALWNLRRVRERILHEHVLSHSSTGAPWYSSFSLKRFIFLKTGKNCHLIVFTVLQIYIKVESRSKCGRVVGSSGRIPALI